MKFILSLTIALCAVSLSAVSASSQTTPPKKMPTREETIMFLKKKLDEAKDLTYLRASDGVTVHIMYQNVSGPEGAVKSTNITSTNLGACEEQQSNQEITFNPAQILDVIQITNRPSDSLGFVQVKLSSKTAKLATKFFKHRSWFAPGGTKALCTKFGVKEETTVALDTFNFAFLKTDPANFEKIKKALFHLRDLDKAADADPFDD